MARKQRPSGQSRSHRRLFFRCLFRQRKPLQLLDCDYWSERLTGLQINVIINVCRPQSLATLALLAELRTKLSIVLLTSYNKRGNSSLNTTAVQRSQNQQHLQHNGWLNEGGGGRWNLKTESTREGEGEKAMRGGRRKSKGLTDIQTEYIFNITRYSALS